MSKLAYASFSSLWSIHKPQCSEMVACCINRRAGLNLTDMDVPERSFIQGKDLGCKSVEEEKMIILIMDLRGLIVSSREMLIYGLVDGQPVNVVHMCTLSQPHCPQGC